MKTVVFQSYRTSDVPHWIARCMQSVREWTATNGHEYRFYDDRIFDLVPTWYREAVKGRLLPMSDLARLKAASELLRDDVDRVIWLDADILVFDPQHLDIDSRAGFAVCPEVWIRKEWGAPIGEHRINNAAMLFDRGNPFLDFFVHATEERVRRSGAASSDWVAGPELLTPLNAVTPLPCIAGVGLLSPLVMHGIANGEPKWLERHANDFGQPIHAANLCGSGAGRIVDGVPLTDDLYHATIDALVNSRGDVVNRYLRAQACRPG